MVPIDMSQYDCPYERNSMMNDKCELCHKNNPWKKVKSQMVQSEENYLISIHLNFKEINK